MKFEVYNRISNMATKEMIDKHKAQYAETYETKTIFYAFPIELVNNLKQYIIDNYEAGNVRFCEREAIELDKDDYINQLLMHMFYAETEPNRYRVTVDIMVEAEDESDAEGIVVNELYNCHFDEVSIDSVYED